VWIARYTGRNGKRHIAKPSWNRGKGTFERKAEAQTGDRRGFWRLRPARHFRRLLRHWTERHPGSERTNATNNHRISRLTDVEVERIALKD
jgi:hypothetical protein